MLNAKELEIARVPAKPIDGGIFGVLRSWSVDCSFFTKGLRLDQ
jgi:hypothetical protein